VRGRVLLVAPPFAGHLHPLLILGHGLAARGYEPVVATGAAKVDLARSLGFRAHALLADEPLAMERIAETPGPVRSNPVLLARQLSANLALWPRARRDLEAIVDREAPDAVVADFTAPVAGIVAEASGVPWLTTIPTPFAIETRTGTPSYCGGWEPPRHPGHRLRDALGRAVTRGTKLAFQRALAGRFREAGVRVYRPDGTESAYSPQAILGLGMSELEFPRDWPAAFEMAGPVTATPGTFPEPHLPEGPLVLVTLGTHLHWAKRGLVRAVRAMAAAHPRLSFAVTLGDAARAAPDPHEVHGNVAVFHHLVYDVALPRCVAVVHHGGAGIAYSAIRAGVPAVVWPQDYDQFDYAARIVAAGAGVRVRHLTGGAGAVALSRALELDSAPLRRLAVAAQAYDPVGATERAIHRLSAGSLPARPGTSAAPGAPSPAAPAG
jgi:UDP:flavonoid glycosyltransferase YjiC (YdhE family)